MNYNKILKSTKVELNNLRLDILNSDKFITSKEEEEIVKSIEEKGYCVLESFYPKEWCEKAKNEIDRLILAYNKQIWKDEAESDHRIFGADRVSPFIKNYYEDSKLLSLLQTYEGREVKDGFTLGAKLEAAEGNKGSGGGWHRDHPNVKQSKSIVYLTDVSLENGPFQYIEASHTSKILYRDSFNYKYDQFQNRFTEEEIQRLLDKEPERLKTFTASAGTVILTDTRGIHRGKPIEDGFRYALTNYLWMHSNIPSHIAKTLVG
ncbi:phytanoyl-CoA dioxygenase family protein [Christiangramia portivictoriae]|uniref:phytanoyl-CoA dioxygenase family protein n=1 Tax=Christiangramia portivictoriae TaxID=326069 RepID=UPI000417F0C4|nr:phytanoyl-CoA dioxygenase family protein [Christiangramia portivictoriae]